MKAPEITVLDCTLKVKQYLNTPKFKKKIQSLSKETAAPISVAHMLTFYDWRTSSDTFF